MDRGPMNLPLLIFGGQEVIQSQIWTSAKVEQICKNVNGAKLLVQSCHLAFLGELASLTPGIFKMLHIRVEDFGEPTSVVNPPGQNYSRNPVLSGTLLVLRQSLQYLQLLEGFQPNNMSTTQLPSDVAVSGYSSGILCASIVASSNSLLSVINNAVEAYRLAFWIGVRVYIAQTQMDALWIYDSRPWAAAFLNISSKELQERVYAFNQDKPQIYITAHISSSSFTVSGHPDHLSAFKEKIPDTAFVTDVAISALYHVPLYLGQVLDQTLADVFSRGIRFPNFDELVRPLRSCATGEIITPSSLGDSLLKSILKMILIEPIHWDFIVQHITAEVPTNVDVNIFGFGLRPLFYEGLEKSLIAQGLPGRQVDFIDVAKNTNFELPELIAIVGVAVKLPHASNLDDLWDLLCNKVNTAEDIPIERFDIKDYQTACDAGPQLKVSKANFIGDAARFDNDFFDISPREAKNMDPQQRILLHVAHEALQDAGYVPHSTPSFSTNTFGCYIGAATSDYVQNLKDDIDVYYSTGTLSSFLSGRLSYHLGFSGPSMVLDTACSSSLVAIQQAVRGLINRDCNAALAGGVNIISSPEMFMGLDRAHFLSPSGECRPFDATADGYGRSEGCGVFVLKRLKDALKDNDRVHGIIRSIELNHSGKSQSITRPHPPTQEELFKKVLKAAALRPIDVSFVEAHGTGTQVGDVTEMESIRAVLAVDRPRHSPLHIGSIKANIGHLEAASGAASLAKVLLMMKHHSIPAQISLRNINPAIAHSDKDGCRLNSEAVEWALSHGTERVALINNFGASGSNAAALIEEFRPHLVDQHHFPISSYVFGLSAKDGDALERARANLINWLKCHPDVSLADLSYTLTARQISYAYRLAVSSSTVPELISEITRASIVRVQPTRRSIVFVFSGQGGHYLGMGCGLYRSSPVFREHINECDSILVAGGFNGILPLITGDRGFAYTDVQEPYQAATFSLQYSLAKLWMSWGITPTALVGHSLGEYAALVIAGSLTLREALIIIATRARLMFQKCGNKATGMLAVSSSATNVRQVLDSSARWSALNISCVNSPSNCVVSGSLEHLWAFKAHIELECFARADMLDVPFAFHSPAMAPIFSDMQEVCKKVAIKSPALPVASAYFGRLIRPDDHPLRYLEYLPRHCVDPVHFADAVESYICHSAPAGGTTAWLEIGPHPTLLPMLKSFPQLSDSIFLPSLQKREPCWITMAKTLTVLYHFHTVNWRAVFAQIGPASLIDVPPYPFSTKTFWIPYKKSTTTLMKPKLQYSFIRSWVRYPSSTNRRSAIFETPILDFGEFLEGHRVGGVSICSASVYIEFVAAGLVLCSGHLFQSQPAAPMSFSKIAFDAVLGKHTTGCNSTKVKLELDPIDGSFSVTSYPVSHERIQHVSGKCRLLQGEVIKSFQSVSHGVNLRIQALLKSPAVIYSSRTMYDVIFPRVVDYSKTFQVVRKISLSADKLEAVATVCLGSNTQLGTFVMNPLFIDSLIHIPGFLSNLHGGVAHVYICSEISSVTVVPAFIGEESVYTVFSSAVFEGEDILCTSYAFTEGEDHILVAQAEGIRFKRLRLSSFRAAITNNVPLLPQVSSEFSDSELADIQDSTNQNLVTLPSTLNSQTLLASPSIRGIIAKTLELDSDNLQKNDELAGLGLDSLSSIELIHAFRKSINSAIPSNLLGTCRTIGDLEAFFQHSETLLDDSSRPLIIKAPSLRSSDEALVHIQGSQLLNPPLILVHDGSGLVASYHHITNLQRPVYGVADPNLFFPCLMDMAHHYASLIKRRGFSSVILGGWSFGGVVGFEVAKILQAMNIHVMGVLLIDCPDPFNHVPLSSSLIDDLMSKRGRRLGNSPVLCEAQFLKSAELLRKHNPTPAISPLHIVYLESKEGYKSLNSNVDVPDWLAQRSPGVVVCTGWALLTSEPIRVLKIPGNHFEAFDPQMVWEVSKRLAEGCEYLELL